MDYQTVLEKAILEYAASATAHPKTKTNGSAKIPGFMNDHVWAMATELQKKGFVLVSNPDGDKGVNISDIQEAGKYRLQEITELEQQLAAEEKAKRDEAIAQASHRKWWKRAFGRGNSTARS
ncbi:MAG: hypothetical protein BMS9Abin05_1676 [Rhodothermia bacterium]|nr:MAG: hypothetical protein BMS9Abin05_1676 [Rhodothermia bacterium]